MDLGCLRLRAVSLFSWSVELNARDTQMTTRVTECFFLPGCRPRFSRLAASPLNARSCARALPLLNLKKKRDCSQSKAALAEPAFIGTILYPVACSSLRTVGDVPLPLPLCLVWSFTKTSISLKYNLRHRSLACVQTSPISFVRKEIGDVCSRAKCSQLENFRFGANCWHVIVDVELFLLWTS